MTKERSLIATASILVMPINGFRKGEWWVSLISKVVVVVPLLLYWGLGFLGQLLSLLGSVFAGLAYLFCLGQRRFLLSAQNSNLL